MPGPERRARGRLSELGYYPQLVPRLTEPEGASIRENRCPPGRV